MRSPAATWSPAPTTFVVEAFGNATLLVRCDSLDELAAAVACAHGSLGASLYCGRDGRDDAAFERSRRCLLARAGRVVENRMPTGLAVTPPMQHGGPWPSAGPPFFSAVGLPWSILRFARRICFDGWTERRLPGDRPRRPAGGQSLAVHRPGLGPRRFLELHPTLVFRVCVDA